METYTRRVYSSNVQTSVQYVHIYIYVCQSNTCGWKRCLFWCTTNKRHRYTHRIMVRACSLQESSVPAAINKPGYMESSSAYI